ncbi:MAG TPA: TlpA disulfide reductase family protein [Candidatus Dormibacteraeota bacterium]|nr:TlpA disulfide reductase family protein [Candidatus Dormibacteraeota bacterium]
MKTISVAMAALVLLIAGIKAAPARADYQASFKVVTPDQLKDVIAANKGKVVYLNFFATYCVPCRSEFPDIVKLQKELGDQGLQVIEVSMNDHTDPSDNAAMKQYLEHMRPTFPVYIASSVEDSFYSAVNPKWEKDGEALPMTTIYDRNGNPAHYYEKALNLQQMEQDVKPLLAAK